MVKKKSVKRFTDNRGFVFEPLDGQLLAQQKNVHVVVSRPGAVRGNHYHRKGTETLVICGPALVRIRNHEHTEDIRIPIDTTCKMIIPPGISHAICNTGTTDSVLVAFNTVAHDPDNPDWVEDVIYRS